MKGRTRTLWIWAALVATLATGCEQDSPPRLPEVPRTTAPARPPSETRTVHTVLTLTQRELGSPGEVVVERRRRCLVEWIEHPAQLRLVQGWPEQVRMRSGDLPWERVVLDDASSAEAQELPGGNLLRTWLPSTRVEEGQRWTRHADLNLAGVPLPVEHTSEVERAPDGRLRVTMRAHGERAWGSTGVRIEIEGVGSALVLDQPTQWPEQVEVTYLIRVTGGPGADAESRVQLLLTLEEQPRS